MPSALFSSPRGRAARACACSHITKISPRQAAGGERPAVKYVFKRAIGEREGHADERDADPNATASEAVWRAPARPDDPGLLPL